MQIANVSKVLISFCVATSSLLAFAQATTVATIQVPSEAVLAQFPKMAGFRMSPDGKHMLAIESQGDVRNILVWKLDNLSKPPTVIGSSSMQIRSASFVKNDLLSVDLTQPFDSRLGELTKTFITKTLFTDLEGKEWREPRVQQVTPGSSAGDMVAKYGRPTVLSTMPSDPDHLIMQGGGIENDVYKYNFRTGVITRVMLLADRDSGVYVDRLGVPMAKRRSGTDSKGIFITLDFRNPTSGAWEEHFRQYAKDREVVDIV
jgi:hypothetical protein